MADISAEIAAFKNAVYGEDVRDAMVSLANKLNNVVTSSEEFLSRYGDWLTLFYTSAMLPSYNAIPAPFRYFSAYYTLNDSTVDRLNPTVSTTGRYACGYEACSPGDKYWVFVNYNNSIARVWAFVDNSGNILSTCDPTAVSVATILTAPDNAAYILYNIRNDIGYFGIVIKNGAGFYLSSNVGERIPSTKWMFLPHDGDTITERTWNRPTATSSASSKWKLYRCRANPGDKFLLYYLTSITNIHSWGFLDKDLNIIEYGDGTINRLKIVTAPENTYYFYAHSNAEINPTSGNEISTVRRISSENDIFRKLDYYQDRIIATPEDLVNFGNGVVASTGELTSTGTHATDYINCSGMKYLQFICAIWNSFNDVGIVFYNTNKERISAITDNYDSTQPYSYRTEKKIVKVPNGAMYFRTHMRQQTADKFYVEDISDLYNKLIELNAINDSSTNILYHVKNPSIPSDGFSNRVITNQCTDVEDITISVLLNQINTNTNFILGTEDVLGASHASQIQFDFENNLIKIANKSRGNALSSSFYTTVDISSMGVLSKALIKVGRKDRQLWVSCEDYYSSNKISYTVVESDDATYKYAAGWLADKLWYGFLSGGCNIEYVSVTTKKNPDVVFIGDSITEGFGLSYNNSWPKKVIDQLGITNYLCMGRSGGNMTTVNMQLDTICSKIKPKFIVVEIGTNGGNTQSNIQNMIDNIYKIGATPIICAIPMKSSGTNDVNSVLRQFQETIVGFDYATSTGSTTLTQDTTKFLSDMIHPNSSGTTAMADRFIADAGSILGYFGV